MSLTNNNKKDEYYFYKLRREKPNRIYVSKEFPFVTYKNKLFNKKRYIKKAFSNKEDLEFVKINGEIILRATPVGGTQTRVIVYTDQNDESLMTFTLQKFRESTDGKITPVIQSDFSFTQNEWYKFIEFLDEIQYIDLSNKARFTVDLPPDKKRKISINLKDPLKPSIKDYSGEELAKLLNNLEPEQKKILVELSQKNIFTKVELDILSGRKSGLEEFKKYIESTSLISEKEWQQFFENNSWIFGYGLDYKFYKILQREAKVSDSNIDGKDTVISDFLLSDTRFTVLVELKTPNTKLFNSTKNRARSWSLSNELTHAVSQILAQKAEWELKSSLKDQYDLNGNRITEYTVDPKTILVIGHSDQFKGSDRISTHKAKTFELYRRNLRNIEIITFDELYDRARFIIDNNSIRDETVFEEPQEYDDLPF